MFVSHDPYNCFDVQKNDDRCVCGFSATGTSSEGEDRGYCRPCAEKRKLFVNDIIGDIPLGRNNSILEYVENLRKAIFRERLYFMVDSFFASRQSDEPFIVPYEDDDFIEKCYREKAVMRNIFLESFESTTPKKFVGYYEWYQEQLEMMGKLDREHILNPTSKLRKRTLKSEREPKVTEK